MRKCMTFYYKKKSVKKKSILKPNVIVALKIKSKNFSKYYYYGFKSTKAKNRGDLIL